MNRKNKSVSFDLTDAYERKLLAHAEQADNGKYSKYIKRLIAKDMEGVKINSVVSVVEVKDDDRDEMQGFL